MYELREAIREVNVQSVQALVKADPTSALRIVDPHTGNTLLHEACNTGNCHILIIQCMVKTFKTMGPPNTSMEVANKCGDTALHVAASHGHVDVVRCLVELGKFNVRAVNEDGQTALFRAVFWNRLATVQCLVELGGNRSDVAKLVDVVDTYGYTVLHWACNDGRLAIARYLVESAKMTNIHSVTKGGSNCADLALQNGHRHVVTYLQSSCNVVATDWNAM